MTPSSKDLVDTRVQEIEWFCRQKVDHLLNGKYESIFKGKGIEFDEVRPYQYGDDVRNIDWNVTARTGLAHIKRFHEERENNVIFVLDASRPFLWSTLAKDRLDTAAEFIALLGSCAVHSNDAIGLLLATDHEHWQAPRRGRPALNAMLDSVLRLQLHEQDSILQDSLANLGQILHKRSIIVVISDDFPEAIHQDLAILNQHHELMCLKISDPRDDNGGLFGQHLLRDSAHRVRNIFKANKGRSRPQNRDHLQHHGIECLDVTLPTEALAELLDYFHLRHQRVTGSGHF